MCSHDEKLNQCHQQCFASLPPRRLALSKLSPMRPRAQRHHYCVYAPLVKQTRVCDSVVWSGAPAPIRMESVHSRFSFVSDIESFSMCCATFPYFEPQARFWPLRRASAVIGESPAAWPHKQQHADCNRPRQPEVTLLPGAWPTLRLGLSTSRFQLSTHRFHLCLIRFLENFVSVPSSPVRFSTRI